MFEGIRQLVAKRLVTLTSTALRLNKQQKAKKRLLLFLVHTQGMNKKDQFYAPFSILKHFRYLINDYYIFRMALCCLRVVLTVCGRSLCNHSFGYELLRKSFKPKFSLICLSLKNQRNYTFYLFYYLVYFFYSSLADFSIKVSTNAL